MKRICLEAKVPQVTAHGMRGLHSTLALEHGASAHVVASFPRPRVVLDNGRELREARGDRRGASVELNGIEPSASSMPFRGEVKKNQ